MVSQPAKSYSMYVLWHFKLYISNFSFFIKCISDSCIIQFVDSDTWSNLYGMASSDPHSCSPTQGPWLPMEVWGMFYVLPYLLYSESVAIHSEPWLDLNCWIGWPYYMSPLIKLRSHVSRKFEAHELIVY